MPLEAIGEIADMLDLSPAEVHDTMTFYGFFRDGENPLGKTRLWVCRSLACMLRGGEELLDALVQTSWASSAAARRRTARSRWSSPSASARARGRRRAWSTMRT